MGASSMKAKGSRELAIKYILIIFVSVLLLMACTTTVTPERLQKEYERREGQAREATIFTSLEYQGATAEFHYIRLNHGGFDSSTDYRLSVDDLRSEIKLQLTKVERNWVPCRLRSKSNGQEYVIEPLQIIEESSNERSRKRQE
jgi:hypothetical protein